MRGLIQFAVVVAVLFFGVGEWQGWYLGVPPHTPMILYKKDHVVTVSRRTMTAQSFDFGLEGRLRQGRLTVEAYYERPESFQTGRPGESARRVYQETFAAGQSVRVAQTLRQGQGIYRVRLTFEDSSGTLRLRLPEAGTL